MTVKHRPKDDGYLSRAMKDMHKRIYKLEHRTGSQRVTQLDYQPLDPSDDPLPEGFGPLPGPGPFPGAIGVPIVIPPGLWALSITVGGNYDYIAGGFIYTVTGPGGGSISFSAWLAARPETALDSSGGSMTTIPVSGGTVTPGIFVWGTGEGPVTAITRFDPCEAPITL